MFKRILRAIWSACLAIINFLGRPDEYGFWETE